MSGSALATAGALASVSMAYRLGGLASFLLGKTMEAAAGQAFEITIGNTEPGYQTIYKHSIQYILMEMDVEAKVSAMRSLVKSIEHTQRENRTEIETEDKSEDYVLVAVESLKEIMDNLMKTLHKIYGELDAHAQKWFNSWRKPLVFEDLEMLRTQCKVFDKRLDTLTKCLAIHSRPSSSGDMEHAEHNGDLANLSFYTGDEVNREETHRNREMYATESMFYQDDAVVL